MAPTSTSSTKKAARLAQKGKGRKVRFQGGALFPFVVALVLVLGFALIAYARESRPAADASAPQTTDHWHHVYGFYLCNQWVQVAGNAEDTDANGQPLNPDYTRTGIHSHDDGLIHWHAFTSLAVGRRAKLGVFFDVYNLDVSTTKLEFPEDQRSQLPAEFQEAGVFESGETPCVIDGESVDSELSVTAWDNLSDTDAGTTYISDYDNIALDKDAMVVTIAFVPDGTEIPKPPWITDFDTNSQIDAGQQPPVTPGSVPDGSVPTGSAPAASTPAASTPAASTPAETTPVTTDG